jgi:pyruvate-ferredoxin/flavodoxin oxidoreductase
VQVLVDLPGEPPPVPGEIAAAPPTSIGVDPAAPAPELAVEEAPGLALAPYIESEKCTSCDECINLSRKLFGYDEKRHAFIKDPKAGSFRELVLAAERCPAGIIHPGTPQNPREKGLEEWIRRAERFS